MRPILNRLIELMLEAEIGGKIAVIGEDIPNTCLKVGFGTIYFRGFALSGLKTIRVDTVWFIESQVPKEVELVGRTMTRLSKEPRIFKGSSCILQLY